MGFATGISKIREASERNTSDFPNKLKIAPDSSVSIRLINEFDPDSPNYSPERGLVGVIDLHTHPDKSQWYKRAECTMSDEGRCVGCERSLPKKRRLFFNVLSEDADGNPAVFYYDVSVFKSTIYSTLLEYFTETGSVSDRVFKIKRKGSGMSDTEYVMIAGAEDKKPFDWTGIKPYELTELIPPVPYEKQAEFYGPVVSSVADEEQDSKPEDLQWV